MSQRVLPDNLPWPELPREKFACLSIDIPWHFETRAPTKNPQNNRSPQKHYPTVSPEYAATLDVRSIAARDAWLWFHIPPVFLIHGTHIPIMRAYGFRVSALAFVWVKTKRKFTMAELDRTPLFEADLHMGTAYTTRQNVELVVLGRRGSAPRLCASVRQVLFQPETLFSPLREHSRKPDEMFKRIEAFCAGPRIDMFAGAERPGWTSWGYPHRDGERA